MTKLHPETEMGAVQIRVSDLTRSIQFYERIVGLKVSSQSEGFAELSADGGETLVVLRETPGAAPFPQRGYAGLYHYAILVPDRKTLGLVLRNLVEQRVPIGASDHLVSEALYLSDPDGNGIEIYRDRPRSEWDVSPTGEVRMVTDPLDGQSVLNEAEGAKWVGMPKGTKMGHVHLHVGDLQKAQQFYCDILGLDVTTSMGGSALFVSAGGYHHHLGLNIWAGQGITVAPEGVAGLDYFTIQQPDAASMEQVQERIKQAGYTVNTKQDGSFETVDPFGITIRFERAKG